MFGFHNFCHRKRTGYVVRLRGRSQGDASIVALVYRLIRLVRIDESEIRDMDTVCGGDDQRIQNLL